eukprot:364197-Chlamydomonas_euryale.AAC.24
MPLSSSRSTMGTRGSCADFIGIAVGTAQPHMYRHGIARVGADLLRTLPGCRLSGAQRCSIGCPLVVLLPRNLNPYKDLNANMIS